MNADGKTEMSDEMRVEYWNDIQSQALVSVSRTFRSCAVNLQLCMNPHITHSLRHIRLQLMEEY